MNQQVYSSKSLNKEEKNETLTNEIIEIYKRRVLEGKEPREWLRDYFGEPVLREALKSKGINKKDYEYFHSTRLLLEDYNNLDNELKVSLDEEANEYLEDYALEIFNREKKAIEKELAEERKIIEKEDLEKVNHYRKQILKEKKPIEWLELDCKGALSNEEKLEEKENIQDLLKMISFYSAANKLERDFLDKFTENHLNKTIRKAIEILENDNGNFKETKDWIIYKNPQKN